jgi:hypothetical protein
VTPQFGASLTDDSRVVIYDHNMFIIVTKHEVPISEHTQYKVLPSGGLLPGFIDSKSHKSLWLLVLIVI